MADDHATNNPVDPRQIVSVLGFDAYYRDRSHLEPAERGLCNYDHPGSLDHELFVSHLDHLRAGHDIEVPVYDFATHTLSGRFERINAAPMIVIEGILLLAFPEIAARLDFTVFLDVPESVRLERRIRRDVAERGRAPDDVKRQFAATVAPMHNLYVQPHRHEASRIVEMDEAYDDVAPELVAQLAIPQVA